jgi:pantothenate kinase type III
MQTDYGYVVGDIDNLFQYLNEKYQCQNWIDIEMELKDLASRTFKTVDGKGNTVNAIQSGLLYGYGGLVDGMVRRIAEELGYPLEKITVVATGGLAQTIKEASQTIQVVDPYLTLDGLRILYEKNKNAGK